MKRLLIGLLALVPVVSYADAQDVLDYYKKHKSDALIEDLWGKNMFAPPYESYDSLIGMAKVCKSEFFDEEPMYRAYAQIGAKDDFLGTAAGKLSLVEGLFTNSGGLTSLYDYVSEDTVYLLNVRNRAQAKEAAKKLYSELKDSPQIMKLKASKIYQIVSDKEKKKNATKEDLNNVKAYFQCIRADVYYTILGGEEFSNSAQTLAGVKRQIHRVTMDDSMSQLNQFLKEQ